MAPNRETLIGSSSKIEPVHKPTPSRLSMENLQRTISDISLELAKEAMEAKLPPISEVEDAKCECCGMSEECTNEYISRVRDKYSGNLICGLCAEAVKEEMEKNGGKRDEALSEHMGACVRFNKLGRSYPVLYQADAIKEILKKSSRNGSASSARAKSLSPRDYKGSGVQMRNGGLARSSSCIPALRKEIDQDDDRKMVN
ncbi:hypothetical protein UlMin_034865 [Ulmus minor]